jgi:broad specificity phosphatase PhoE
MKFYIFRHGETYQTKYNLEYEDEQLTSRVLPEGLPETKRLANYLKGVNSDANLSSEILRCRETVEIVSKISGKEFSFDKRLNEFLEDDFEKLKKRLKDFIDDIKKQNYKSVLICTHGAVIAGLKHLLTEGKFEITDLTDFPQPGSLLILEGKSVELVSFRAP